MSETVHATLRASVEDFKRMIEQSSLDGDTEYSDIYLNILDDRVQILQSAPGEVVLTFCSFGEEYFDEIDLNKTEDAIETTDSSGNDVEYVIGAEAILDVEQTITYLDFASDGGTVELSFTGDDENQRTATYARAEGALEAWVRLPGSDDALSQVPYWLPDRFNDDNVYTNTAGDEAPTKIDTKVSNVETIIRAVEDDRDAEFFPIVVRDGVFTIDVGDDQRSGVRGSLGAQSVSGPDVENNYLDGFKEIFNVLSGHVQLQTAPGGNPLSIVQEGGDGRVIRHVNGSINN